MDNLCHTLVGAALAEAGLKRRTRLGAATLMIGANFPDIDVLSIPLGKSLQFRRGDTHGLLAMVVLPFVLAALMLGWDRLGRRRAPERAPAVFRQLLLLSAVSIVTHPVLDWMNTYGVRWLMPFSNRWFYGDALFIMDPWMWLMLGIGVFWSLGWERRAGRDATARTRATFPARAALAIAATYVALMVASTLGARAVVRRSLARDTIVPATLMVEPAPANPLPRGVVYRSGGAYHLANFSWLRSPRLTLLDDSIPVGVDDPLARAAAASPQGRAFLRWARLPFFVVDRRATPPVVTIGDARYASPGRLSWAAVRITLSPSSEAPAGAPR